MQIIIKDLEIKAFIGLLEKERDNAQMVIIDSLISYDYDDKYINYAEIVEIISNMIKVNKYELLEVGLNDISSYLFDRFSPIKSIFLSIKKPAIIANCVVGVQNTFYR